MGGQYVRRASTSHRCDPPRDGRVRDVWQCDCGRRWTCTASAVDSPHLAPEVVVVWHRRWWPWPRLQAATEDEEDVDAMVDRMMAHMKASVTAVRVGDTSRYFELMTMKPEDFDG